MNTVTSVIAGLSAFASLANAQDTCWQGATCNGPADASFHGDWDDYILSPASRTVQPVTILNRLMQPLNPYPNAQNVVNGTVYVYDFGKEVGGLSTIGYTFCGAGTFGVSWSEAANFTGMASDNSNGGSTPDGALTFDLQDGDCNTPQTWSPPLAQQRGGFRYLSVYALTDNVFTVNVTSVDVEISFAPTWGNLQAYGGYFKSSDDLLNKIWYACAYTIQTTTISPKEGREWGPATPWANDADLGIEADAIYVDGAKRDRASWSGDLGVALRSAFVSVGDWVAAGKTIQLQYDLQV